MKLTLTQALATVFNITEQKSAIVGGEDSYVIKGGGLDGTDWILGAKSHYTLEQAVREAMTHVHSEELQKECLYAIFPMEANRGIFYMQIERELLRQDAEIEKKHGEKLWQLFKDDPRNVVNAIMGQLRGCAQTLTIPPKFHETLIGVGCLVIASLQWFDDWATRLAVRRVIPQTGHTLPPAGMKMHVEKFDDDLRTGQHNQE